MIKVSQAVFDAIGERKRARAAGEADGHHIALVVEGGGMRGVASGGMVSALEELGLLHVFDTVHGSSAGAAAAAYFAVGRAKLGTSLYYEDLNDGRFINRLRPLWGQPVLSPAFLVDYAMTELKPFDFARLKKGAPRLHIVTTDIDQGSSYVVSEFATYQYYRELLKASITLPVIAGQAPVVDGKRLLDGGLLQQIALRSAEGAGATHIVALITRGEHELTHPEPTWWTRVEMAALQAFYGGKVGELYRDRGRTINEQVRQLMVGLTFSGVPVATIGLPAGLNYVHRLTTDADLLRRAAQESYDYTIAAFGHLE